MWTIVEQTEKVGKDERTVLCKHVRFFPKRNKRTHKVEGFGLLRTPVLRVVITNGGVEHAITYSHATNSFTYHQEPKLAHPPLRDIDGRPTKDRKGNVILDVLSPKISVPGETQRWVGHASFSEWLAKTRGEECAQLVMMAFADRMAELAAKLAAKLQKAA